MRITEIEPMVLRAGVIDPTRPDGTQDAFVVRVHTDEGVVGIGEGDTSPFVAHTIVSMPASHSVARGLGEILEGNGAGLRGLRLAGKGGRRQREPEVDDRNGPVRAELPQVEFRAGQLGSDPVLHTGGGGPGPRCPVQRVALRQPTVQQALQPGARHRGCCHAAGDRL